MLPICTQNVAESKGDAGVGHPFLLGGLMRSKFILLFVAILLSIANISHAQRITGAIKGDVSDEEGGPLPGVSVTLSGQALIGGPQVTTTNETGGYRFPALPPGSYTITFEMA